MLKTSVLNAVSKARRALSDLAIDCTLTKRSANTHVPGVAPTYTSSVSPVKLVITDYEAREIDGNRVHWIDKKAILMEPSVIVDPNDVVNDGKSSFRVMSVTPYMVGDVPAVSEVQLRPV